MRKNIQRIENKYKDKDCIIFGSGPSLKDFDDDTIKQICSDKTVFTIKQAYFRIPFCDYHFLNDNNYEAYNYSDNPPDIIVECPSNHRVAFLESIANYFFIVQQNWDTSQALSTTLEFDKWTIAKSPVYRPFGPGLMFETVLFFAYHLGFENIYTIGWDGGPKGSVTRDHYYDERSVVNPANNLFAEESEKEIECSKHFYLWLKSRGAALHIASAGSNMHKIIPRVNLCEF
jgi:hypothetical protein